MTVGEYVARQRATFLGSYLSGEVTVAETPKRLAPTRDTGRELYLKSGNRCAFPGCEKALFNMKGIFIGEICHIEAAETGGPRFNPAQTNEQRRHFSNLLLMCHDHHLETDDVSTFPVDRMARIKREHEQIYSDVVGSMLLQVSDHTKLQDYVPATNLRRMATVLGWSLEPTELSDNVKDLNDFLLRLKNLPRPARQVLAIIVERAERSAFGSGLELSVAELHQVTGLGFEEMRGLVRVLDKYGFVGDNGEHEGLEMVGLGTTGEGWPIWKDLRKFSKREGIGVAEFVVGLDFSILDE